MLDKLTLAVIVVVTMVTLYSLDQRLWALENTGTSTHVRGDTFAARFHFGERRSAFSKFAGSAR